MTSKETPRKEYFKWENVDHCGFCGSSNNSDRFTNVFMKKKRFSIKNQSRVERERMLWERKFANLQNL